MKENNELKIQETTSPESKESSGEFRLKKTPELEIMSNGLTGIKNAIDHNEKITEGELSEIENGLDELTVDVAGEKMTVKELRSIPDMEKNAEIWKEIKNGDYGRAEELTYIIPAIAEILSKSKKDDILVLHLNGLKSISDEVAEILSKYEGYLYLNGITSISEKTAKALSEKRDDDKDDWLQLNGLTSISKEIANNLSKFKGWLDLDGLTSLSDKVAKSLAKHKGNIGLSGLTSLSAQTAKILSKHEGDIILNGLTSISDEAAEALSLQKNGGLMLNSLISLSDKAAESFAKHKGGMGLQDLTDISEKAIKLLAKNENYIGFHDDIEDQIKKFKDERN